MHGSKTVQMEETDMTRRFGYWMTIVLATLMACGAVHAQGGEKSTAPIEIRISYQPAFWALPWFIADDKGWWDKVGLKPTMTSFAAGAAQIAAGASNSWDVGGAGDIPLVLGGAKYGLLNIAISDMEPAILTIMAASDEVAQRYKSDPALFRDKQIPATLSSNGERVAVACLARMGAAAGSYRLVNLAPADINAAMLSRRFDIAAVWAPNTYILEASMGAKVICRGTDTGLTVTGRLFVTPDYAAKNAEGVARFLALYFHAIEWQKAHPKETLEYLAKFYEKMGVKVPANNLVDEVRDHPHPTLQEQLKLYDRGTGGTSKVDDWTDEVAKFLVDKGSIPSAPATKSYVTDKFLKMVADNPVLMKFATDGSN